jgi:uncharacterized protein (TIGR02147 family)
MSLRDFARAAGFRTHTFLTNVINGKRSLTGESATKMARGLGLSARERVYFELLVRFDNAKTIDERNACFRLICAALPRNATKRIREEAYDIFRDPHVLTIRELVAMPDFKEDPEWIAHKLRPSVSPRQAKAALEILLRAGLLVRDKNGKLLQETADLSTGPEVRSLAVSLYHRKVLKLADEAINSTPAKDRDLSSLILNTSKSEFDFIKRRIIETRAEILDFLKKKRDLSEEKIFAEKERALYYLNIQFFNATELPWTSRSKNT